MSQTDGPVQINPEGQQKINQINETLGKYTTVLAQCIKSRTTDHTITKQKLKTITDLIDQIKEKINTTKNNVKQLEDSRLKWQENLRERTEAENVKLKQRIANEQNIEADLKTKMEAQEQKNQELKKETEGL